MHSTFNLGLLAQTSWKPVVTFYLHRKIFNFRRFRILLDLSPYLDHCCQRYRYIIFQLQKRLTLICIAASCNHTGHSSQITTNLLPCPKEESPMEIHNHQGHHMIEHILDLSLYGPSNIFCDTKYHLEILIFEISKPILTE